MNASEIRFIAELCTFHEFGGMNFHRGGEGGRSKGWKPSEPERQRLASQIKIANKKWREERPEEARRRIEKVLAKRGEAWLSKLRAGVEKVPHAVHSERARAGWVTRKRNKGQQSE